MEGRAARRRVRRLLVGRAHGLRGRGRRDRGLGGDARRRAALLPRGRPRPGPRRCTTASTPSSGRPTPDPDRVRALGVDPDRPSVVFVGRITRQKGLPLFLRAVAQLPPDVQVVLCAGAPDTPEIEAEVVGPRRRSPRVARRRRLDPGHAPPRRRRRPAQRRHRVRLPVDLRAARHRQPRGDGLRDRGRRDRDRRHPRGRRRPALRPRRGRGPATGRLVPIDQATDGTGTPLDPDRYVADFAAALIEVVTDPDRAAAMGRAGRQRAIDAFSWAAIAERTTRGLPLGALTAAARSCSPVAHLEPRRLHRDQSSSSASPAPADPPPSAPRPVAVEQDPPVEPMTARQPDALRPGPGLAGLRRQHLADQEPQPDRRVARPVRLPRAPGSSRSSQGSHGDRGPAAPATSGADHVARPRRARRAASTSARVQRRLDAA